MAHDHACNTKFAERICWPFRTGCENFDGLNSKLQNALEIDSEFWSTGFGCWRLILVSSTHCSSSSLERYVKMVLLNSPRQWLCCREAPEAKHRFGLRRHALLGPNFAFSLPQHFPKSLYLGWCWNFCDGQWDHTMAYVKCPCHLPWFILLEKNNYWKLDGGVVSTRDKRSVPPPSWPSGSGIAHSFSQQPSNSDMPISPVARPAAWSSTEALLPGIQLQQ